MGEMPWQLKYAKCPKRSEPRPIVESLPSINVNDLKIPRSYDTLTLPNIGLRYPQLASMRLTYHSVEVTHCTSFNLKPIKTGFGYPRYAFVCDKCQQPRIKLYFRYGNLNCRRCSNAIHASQACDKHTRPALQMTKLGNFLTWSMSQRNRQRIQARLRSLAAPQR